MNGAIAGSNFVMRAKHCQEAGWFPTYTMCEDFALALELQSKNYKSAYVQEFLALGEVPVTVRGTFQQRSRSALLPDSLAAVTHLRCLGRCMTSVLGTRYILNADSVCADGAKAACKSGSAGATGGSGATFRLFKSSCGVLVAGDTLHSPFQRPCFWPFPLLACG